VSRKAAPKSRVALKAPLMTGARLMKSYPLQVALDFVPQS